MRILFIEPYYFPDRGPAAPLYTMLCEELVRMNHEVIVLAAVPHYPTGKVEKAYQGSRIRRTNENGVQVIRVPLPSVNRTILWQRFLQFLIYQFACLIAGWNLKADIFLTATPAFMVLLPVVYFYLIRKIPYIYSVHDVYPDSGIRLGIFKHPFFIRLVTGLEKFTAHRSNFIRILSPSYVDPVSKLGISKTKQHLIYDWVDTTLIKPVSKKNDFSVENNLQDKFIIEYAGNISFSQGLEYLIKTAELLRNDGIHFLIIGEGAKKNELEKLCREKKLEYVQFLPFQPREKLPDVLGTADISLVTLRKGMGFNSLPSKTLSILASGRPIIANIDPGSETWDLVERAQAGLCIEPESPEKLANAIRSLKDNEKQREIYGKNGRNYVAKNHSPQSAAKAFEELFMLALKKT